MSFPIGNFLAIFCIALLCNELNTVNAESYCLSEFMRFAVATCSCIFRHSEGLGNCLMGKQYLISSLTRNGLIFLINEKRWFVLSKGNKKDEMDVIYNNLE
jgi:hypothetical protein